MTKDQITARIEACEAEPRIVRADVTNGPQEPAQSDLISHRDELVTELAGLRALLEEA